MPHHSARRLIGFSLVAAAVLAVALTAAQRGGAPAYAEYGGPSRDIVVGSGSVTFADFPSVGTDTTEQLVVSSNAGPSGEDAAGTMIVRSPLGDVRVAVTCLAVEGDSAIVGGTIVSGVYLGQTFSRLAAWIDGAAPGASGQDDGWTGLIFSHPWQDPCARLVELTPFIPGFAPLPLEQGAFTVTDAQ